MSTLYFNKQFYVEFRWLSSSGHANCLLKKKYISKTK